MAKSGRSSTSALLFFLPLLFVSSSANEKPVEAPAGKPQSLPCDVKSDCLNTPYPDVCKSSTSLLSPVGTSELPLVIRGMLGLSITAAKSASLQLVDGFTGFGIGDASADSCGTNMQQAVSTLEGAMKDVNLLSQPGGAEFAQRVAGIELQVSKAVSVSSDCLKLLRGVPSGFGPTKAAGSVDYTAKLASNLLVFVRKLQATTTTR